MTETGKTAVVTGASSGIGLATARELAGRGWRVIALGRTKARAEKAFAEIRAAATGPAPDLVLADLSVMAEAKRAAADVAARADRIDVLVNNAGNFIDGRQETPDGLELSFAGNHLGPFLFTRELLPLLRKSKGARILNISSVAHTMIPGMNWDDLQYTRGFASNTAYAQSKLANVLFTTALARRLKADGITVNAVHPGQVDSNFANVGGAFLRDYYAKSPGLLTPEQGADTIVWLATDPAGGTETGGYFADRKRIPPSPAAQEESAAERLWAESERLLAGIEARG